jgi:DNA-binding protein HU-beta
MPSTATPCQIKPYPTRHLPRNNAPLNLRRSHEKACAAQVCRVHVHDPFLNSLPIPKKFCVSEQQRKINMARSAKLAGNRDSERRFAPGRFELQVALATATETNKKTAGVFLDTLSALAYKEIKKNGEFVLPGFGKLVKQKRKARTGFNPKTKQKMKIPAKTVVKFRVAKAAKDAVLGVKK